MCPASSPQVTELLTKWGQGDAAARESLIPLVYDELRRIARRHLWRQRADHTLQSAALVNEAYLRLVRRQSPQWAKPATLFWSGGANDEADPGGLCPKPSCCQARGRGATVHPGYEDGLAPKQKRANLREP